MEINNYRTYGEDTIELCKHISIEGSLRKDDEGCEYMNTIKIVCNECREVHKIHILIN